MFFISVDVKRNPDASFGFCKPSISVCCLFKCGYRQSITEDTLDQLRSSVFFKIPIVYTFLTPSNSSRIVSALGEVLVEIDGVADHLQILKKSYPRALPGVTCTPSLWAVLTWLLD